MRFVLSFQISRNKILIKLNADNYRNNISSFQPRFTFSRGVCYSSYCKFSPGLAQLASSISNIKSSLSESSSKGMTLYVVGIRAISYVINYLQSPGLLSAPALPASTQSLDALLKQSWILLRTTRNLISDPLILVDDLQKSIAEARSLNEDFLKWAESQPEEWRPRPIGSMSRQQGILRHNLGWLSGRIDAYLDRESL